MTTKFTCWQEDDGLFLGYLNDDPDHWTQGKSLQDLKDHLRDLHDIYHNPKTGAPQPIPRHKEINELLARKILRDLTKE